MSNGVAAQHSTLSDIQFANMRGFLQDSMLIDVLFWIFVVLIIAYFVCNRKKKY